ncbi:LysR family transcriptional regulator [Pelovirga terrestris]|uniref:LysR family transcriptional regulator n=1 Tax=Pelovirga terrestris TaxID=2771352 RepID=A0A8J6QKU9_9BACT|nr:LysR family transcriptional regulator [Pelovirga terrestris]
MNDLRIRSKIWLEVNGQPFLGGGRLRLLRAIAATGSINAASQQLGISYRKAWSQLQEMEKHGIPLVERERGGSGGGRSVITPQARELLKNFDEVQEGLHQMIDDKFDQVFNS